MSRDISWGADCDSCGQRLNAGRAAECADGDEVICGSCRDETRYAELKDEHERLLGCVRSVLSSMPFSAPANVATIVYAKLGWVPTAPSTTRQQGDPDAGR